MVTTAIEKNTKLTGANNRRGFIVLENLPINWTQYAGANIWISLIKNKDSCLRWTSKGGREVAFLFGKDKE